MAGFRPPIEVQGLPAWMHNRDQRVECQSTKNVEIMENHRHLTKSANDFA